MVQPAAPATAVPLRVSVNVALTVTAPDCLAMICAGAAVTDAPRSRYAWVLSATLTSATPAPTPARPRPAPPAVVFTLADCAADTLTLCPALTTAPAPTKATVPGGIGL